MMLHGENAAKAEGISPEPARPTIRVVLQDVGSAPLILGGVYLSPDGWQDDVTLLPAGPPPSPAAAHHSKHHQTGTRP